jgi:hypothetical protein
MQKGLERGQTHAPIRPCLSRFGRPFPNPLPLRLTGFMSPGVEPRST